VGTEITQITQSAGHLELGGSSHLWALCNVEPSAACCGFREE
jgi:hypothetical protein